MPKSMKYALVLLSCLVVAALLTLVFVNQNPDSDNPQGGGHSGSSTMQFK
ncbi:MAG: hypothetical protein KGL41_06810 [Actinomycetales bacterium]|nr:hypothetical protein [Actinomycetales bacterium]